MSNSIDQEKNKRCFYCEKLQAYITAIACVNNQDNATPLNQKRCCLDCEKGKQIKEMVEMVKRWKWSPNTRIGNCSRCGEFKIIKNVEKFLCTKCEYKERIYQKKERENMSNKTKTDALDIAKYKDLLSRQIVTLDFAEYEGLYEKLTREAKEQFRTIEMQILFIVNQFFQTSGEAF